MAMCRGSVWPIAAAVISDRGRNVEVWPGIHSLNVSPVSNVYLVIGPPLTLIDTCWPGTLRSLIRELDAAGVAVKDLQRIVLTHCDVDHVGNARALQRLSGAEICAHAEAIPYMARDAPANTLNDLPSPGPILRALIRATAGRRTKTFSVDRVLHDGDNLDGLTVLHLPGHTAGHIGVQAGPVLFAGDAVMGGRKPRPLPGFITQDRAAERRTLERMAAMQIELLLPGHLGPVRDAASQIATILESY